MQIVEPVEVSVMELRRGDVIQVRLAAGGNLSAPSYDLGRPWLHPNGIATVESVQPYWQDAPDSTQLVLTEDRQFIVWPRIADRPLVVERDMPEDPYADGYDDFDGYVPSAIEDGGSIRVLVDGCVDWLDADGKCVGGSYGGPDHVPYTHFLHELLDQPEAVSA